MKFTFITTTYNTRLDDFEKMCLSLSNLKYDNWNLLYADDGSKIVDSNEYIKILKELDNEKIFIMDNFENIGICALKDKLINGYENIIGEYIFSLDSDDYISEDFLDKIFDLADNEKPDIIKFNTLNFISNLKDVYTIENMRNLIINNFAFDRIYKFEINILNNCDFLIFNHKKNINGIKLNRFLSFASTRISGPVSTFFKFDFYKKNSLKYTLPDSSINEISIKRNLDFYPVIFSNISDYKEIIINNSGYYYRLNSNSSVTKTFINNDLEINQSIINLFTILFDTMENKYNFMYMVFSYLLYVRYMNIDYNNLFKKFFKSKFKIRELKDISLTEKVAYKLSRNKFTRLIFTFLTLAL